MISDDIFHLPMEEIIIDDRRPIDETHAKALAASIAKDDLIHVPVVERRTFRLCVGGHRYRAWQINRAQVVPCRNPLYEDWTLFPVRFADDYSESDLARIELIENLRHRKLDWREELAGVRKIHNLHLLENPSWTMDNTSDLIGTDRTHVSKLFIVEPHLKLDTVQACETIGAAYNVVKRQNNRTKSVILENIVTGKSHASITLRGLMGEVEEPVIEQPAAVSSSSPIIVQPFAEFAASYAGPRFNFLHCDFPYGIDVSANPGQGAITDINKYDDSPEVYWQLLSELAQYRDKIISHSCHIIFWFSQNFRRETEDFFYTNFPGCVIQPFLMVWHRSDSSGLCPDPQRYGRRNLETAMLITLGDRLIVKVKNLVFPHPGKDKDRLHKSEKPLDVVKYFMEMFVDEHSLVLDPTCGSGSVPFLLMRHIVND